MHHASPTSIVIEWKPPKKGCGRRLRSLDAAEARAFLKADPTPPPYQGGGGGSACSLVQVSLQAGKKRLEPPRGSSRKALAEAIGMLPDAAPVAVVLSSEDGQERDRWTVNRSSSTLSVCALPRSNGSAHIPLVSSVLEVPTGAQR